MIKLENWFAEFPLKGFLCNPIFMHCVAQLVRAPDCGSGGRGFEPHRGAKFKSLYQRGFFISVWLSFFEAINHKSIT